MLRVIFSNNWCICCVIYFPGYFLPFQSPGKYEHTDDNLSLLTPYALGISIQFILICTIQYACNGKYKTGTCMRYVN